MHTIDAACSCACLDVLWSVCELIATVSPAKTAKPIEMPSGQALVVPHVGWGIMAACIGKYGGWF